MAQRADGLNGFIRRQAPPATLQEQLTRSRVAEAEWRESRQLLVGMRARPERDHLESVLGAFASAFEVQDYWAEILAEEFGVVPPSWKPNHKLTAPEYGEFVTAVWNFEYWQIWLVRVVQAMDGATVRGENSFSAGWEMVCANCENQAVELEGGLVRFAAQFAVDTALPTASLAGFAAAGLSLTKNQRLGGTIDTLAKERGQQRDTVLREELQAAVLLAQRDSKAGQSFIPAVAAQLEHLGPHADTDSLDENLDSFGAREAAERGFSEAENGIQLEQLMEQAGLSKREAEYCALALEGIPQTEIAVRMGVAKGTVHSMASRVRSKLQAVAS